MKTRKKMLLGGVALIFIATIALLVSLGVPGKSGVEEREIIDLTDYSGILNRINEHFANIAADLFYSLRYSLGHLAGCIKRKLDKEGIEVTAIGIIPDLRFLNDVYLYYNTGGIAVVRSGDTVAIGYLKDDSEDDDEEVRIVGPQVDGYIWSSTVTRDRYGRITGWSGREYNTGINCVLDTETIRKIVKGCLRRHPNKLHTTEGRIFISTPDGYIVLDSQGEIIACHNWPLPELLIPFEEIFPRF